jgi:hypothetical protein
VAHAFGIAEHKGPVEMHSNAMQCPMQIEVRTDWICMKSNEYNIVELLWYQLETCVGIAPGNGFLHDKHPLLD